MRRSRILLVTALIGTAAAVPAASAARSSAVATPGTVAVEERYGIVRYDPAARRWAILSGGAFRSSGLTGVSCAGSGVLTVTFAPLGTIGTFTVDEDDAYAGRFQAGAALTTSTMAITFRAAAGGAVVGCHSAAVRIPNSSLQVWIRGGRADTPPTTLPTTSRPPTPPTPPTSSVPTQTPSTTQPPTTTAVPTTELPPPPDDEPGESDPADG